MQDIIGIGSGTNNAFGDKVFGAGQRKRYLEFGMVLAFLFDGSDSICNNIKYVNT